LGFYSYMFWVVVRRKKDPNNDLKIISLVVWVFLFLGDCWEFLLTSFELLLGGKKIPTITYKAEAFEQVLCWDLLINIFWVIVGNPKYPKNNWNRIMVFSFWICQKPKPSPKTIFQLFSTAFKPNFSQLRSTKKEHYAHVISVF